MPIQRSTAKKLVSETEFKLINESFPPLVSELSDKALLQRMERARKAKDRYHSMVERQRTRSASGSRRGAASPTNLKEVESKERIFEETLARFERQTAKAGSRAGAQTAMPTTKTPRGTTAGKSASGGTARRPLAGKTKAADASATGIKGGANRPAQSAMGKKTSGKGGAQGTSKASVKMANKAEAKTGARAAGTKADTEAGTKAAKEKGGKSSKGSKGAATQSTPRGRHGAMVDSTTLH